MLRVLHPEQSFLSSPVCRANIATNGHVSRFSEETAAEFLCSSDLLAERVGFETIVQRSFM
jgi:hypothetical protein